MLRSRKVGDYVPNINENLFRADTSAIQSELDDINSTLEDMQGQVDGLANIKEVRNIEMFEGSFTVTYTDGTIAQYTYFTDSDGKIARISSTPLP